MPISELNAFYSANERKRPKRVVMNLLEKFENFINFLLLRLGELIVKSIPAPLKTLWRKIEGWLGWLAANFKQLPAITKKILITFIGDTKKSAVGFNYKAALQDTYKKAMSQAKETSPGLGKLATLLLTPFLMLGQWMKGLSAAQALLLMSFSTGSVLAVIGIAFSGHKLANNHFDASRSPASVEEAVKYERPDYYKKQTRHFEVTNLRLPVYVAKVNEIRSVDIDFTATMTNRNARVFLEKHEFHLRDHLILQMEPSIASFPLEEEGKEIIRRKLLSEIDDFLKQNEVEGEVLELKITYVLAN